MVAAGLARKANGEHNPRMSDLARNLVLLVRHARAEGDSPLGDAARALDSKGRRDFRRQAQALAGRVRLVGIATSPLLRAVQTAEILAGAGEVREVRVLEVLASGSPAKILEAARALGPGWALVGHNPGLEATLRLALGSGAPPKLRKGAAVALALGKRTARLAWLADPQNPRK
jgi:phosphohistidine phosphatase